MRGAVSAPLGAAPVRRKTRLVVLAAVALGLVLRVAFAFGYWVDKPLTHDETEYLRLARNVALGAGFTYGEASPEGTAPRFGRAPLYPAFLAGILRLSGHVNPPDAAPSPGELNAIKAAQAALGAVVIWVIAVIAARAAGARAGAIAAVLAAVYPPLVWIGAYVISESLFMVLALAAVAVLGRVTDRADARHLRPSDDGLRRSDLGPRTTPVLAFAAGVLAGLAALTRPLMLFFFLAAALWLPLRRQHRALVALAIGALLVVLPWTLRNVRATGHVVLIASEGGVTFWTGNNALSRGEGDLAANPAMKRAEIDLRQRHPGWSAEDLEPVYYREALDYIGAHPLAWLALLARKVFYLWVPIGPSYRLHSPRYFYASIVSYGLLLPFAILGFVRLRSAPGRPRALWMLAAGAIAACLVFFPQERFRIPVLDPTFIVCASAWLATCAGRAVAEPGAAGSRGLV